MATPLQAFETELQTLAAMMLAPGAIPLCVSSVLWPAMMSDVCVPCPPAQGGVIVGPPQPIGSSSGESGPLGQASPTKSYPLTTLAVGKRASRLLFAGSAVDVPYAAV